MIKIIRKYRITLIALLLAVISSFVYCATTLLRTHDIANETQAVVRTYEVTNNSIDYQSILDEFENSKLETIDSLTTFEGYKTIDLSQLDGFDLVSDTDIEETQASVKYNFSYDSETNIVTLSAELVDGLGEIQIDTITGAAFINEDGEIDAVMNVDGEGILLSEMQNAGMIENCGWFSRLIRKVVKVVVVAVTVAAVVATAAAVIVATAGSAAPALVAAGVGLVSSGVTTSVAAGAAIAAGATAAAITAGIGVGIAVGETIVEETGGFMTINNTYKIGQEKVDKSTKDLVQTISGTATFTSLRKMSRAYHIAFVVTQKFTENNKSYSVGDLYISKKTFTFGEAYAILCGAGLVNSINKLTNNVDIINTVNTVLSKNVFTDFVEQIKGYHKNGYLGKKAIGIYANSALAATTLAAVTGAWIKDGDTALYAYGGDGGYYHFHDLQRTIHIWYGDKIA